METTKKICCITGHRTQSFPWPYKGDPTNLYDWEFDRTLEDTVEKLVADGYNYFICGGAIGVDIAFAETVIDLRDRKYPHIQLEIAVPCPGQNKKWNSHDKEVYADAIQLADEVNIISEHYTKFCFHRRNEYMVDKSDLVVVVWNGEEKGGTYSTYQYAKRKKKNTLLIKLHDVMKAADESESENIAWQTATYGKPIPPIGTGEWKLFMALEEQRYKEDGTPPSPIVVQKAISEIDLMNKRREKYRKNPRPIP